MIARVADHCFWLGRYIERAESTARVLQVTGALALDAELPPVRCWYPVVIVAGQALLFAVPHPVGSGVPVSTHFIDSHVMTVSQPRSGSEPYSHTSSFTAQEAPTVGTLAGHGEGGPAS